MKNYLTTSLAYLLNGRQQIVLWYLILVLMISTFGCTQFNFSVLVLIVVVLVILILMKKYSTTSPALTVPVSRW